VSTESSGNKTSKHPDRPELLAPVGDWDCLEAAIQNGADAVYLGVKDFNARLYTRNFSLKELVAVVRQAHSNGVRVYLTLNTLVKDREIEAFFNVLSDAYLAGVDGVIIQHISFLDIIKRSFPGLAVFVSTQGAIGNLSSGLMVKQADRIVLPRELPLKEIREFVKAGINTEVFVHGALCYSYSGLCLFSSFVGSRSGNRGSCAQLCRQKYNGDYPLSTKELCLVQRVPELVEAGVKGFKIEGRMRSALYVAVATRLYRKAIDSCLKGHFVLPTREMEEMEIVFNREFTQGLIFGEQRPVSAEKPMNRGALLGQVKDGEIDVLRKVAVGEGVGIWTKGKVSGSIVKAMYGGSKSIQSATVGERVSLGFKIEDGSRVYLTSSSDIRVQPDFRVERSPIKLAGRRKVQVDLPKVTPRRSTKKRLLVKAYSLSEAIESSRAGADIVFLNAFSPEFPASPQWRDKALLGAYLPRIMSQSELDAAVELLRRNVPAAVLTGNLGFLSSTAEFRVPIFVDYSLNTFNDFDIRYFKGYKATPILSPELSLNELSQLKDKDVVVVCHGDIVLANTVIDPATQELVDEKNSRFRVRKENRYWQILNSRPYGLFDTVTTLQDQGFGRFYIDWEGRGPDAVRLYRKLLANETINRRTRRGYTSGHLFNPVS
jgi:collagenase-like PrtC family protease